MNLTETHHKEILEGAHGGCTLVIRQNHYVCSECGHDYGECR
jgi:hypothetical protein